MSSAAGVSVAQVARRNAMNAKMIFKWLGDPRYAPDPELALEGQAVETPCFLPVEIVDRNQHVEPAPTPEAKPSQSSIEIDMQVVTA